MAMVTEFNRTAEDELESEGKRQFGTSRHR